MPITDAQALALDGIAKNIGGLTESIDADGERKTRRDRILVVIGGLLVVLVLCVIGLQVFTWRQGIGRSHANRDRQIAQAEEIAAIKDVIARVDKATSPEAQAAQAAVIAHLIENIDVNNRQALNDALTAIYAPQGKTPPTVRTTPTTAPTTTTTAHAGTAVRPIPSPSPNPGSPS